MERKTFILIPLVIFLSLLYTSDLILPNQGFRNAENFETQTMEMFESNSISGSEILNSNPIISPFTEMAPGHGTENTELNGSTESRPSSNISTPMETTRVGECGCEPVPLEPVTEPYNRTTCGPGAYSRGSGQKVFAFTFFTVNQTEAGLKENKEEERHYFQGIEENLNLMNKLYPGYRMRVYYDVDPGTKDKLCTLVCSRRDLDICDASNNPRLGDMRRLYPLVWRFLPALDPQVDEFYSRDLDSRLSAREKAAVQEFQNSGKMIHVMRDNPNHGASIMGGMWGAKLNPELRNEFKESFVKIFKDGLAYANREGGGWDQIVLKRYIWPWGKKKAYAHDSYTCKQFSYTHSFPTKRLLGVGNYVGSIVSLNATVRNKCPRKCRPKDHKDWSYC